jgi:hypothetical protein
MRLCRKYQQAEIDEKGAEALFKEALRFIRGGGMVDWDLWDSLLEMEQEAMVQARKVYDVENAIRLGTAIAAAGTGDFSPLLAEVDGGAANARKALEEAVGKAAVRAGTTSFALDHKGST